MTPVQAKEVVYQAVAYVGMARAADFVRATDDVLTVLLPLVGYPRTLDALAAMDQVAPA